MNEYFSKNYNESRNKFLEFSKKSGANIDSLELKKVLGPQKEKLFIDISYFGKKDASKVFFHTSGIHGVEGFAGSAIQLSILKNKFIKLFPKDIAIVFIHIINPYGMAWLRRWNETNIDLNRNINSPTFFKKEKCSQVYCKLNELLNPYNVPFNWNLSFLFGGIKSRLWYSKQRLKTGIASGQNFFPKGLFYIGKELEQGPKIIITWLKNNFKNTKQILHIDVHTGLGSYAYDTLLFDREMEEKYNFFKSMGDHVQRHIDPNYIAYNTSGICRNIFSSMAFPKATYYGFTQEFGTYSNFKVLKALRKENYYHNWEKVNIKHDSKKELLEVFNPQDENWQNKIIYRGNIMFNKALQWFSFL